MRTPSRRPSDVGMPSTSRTATLTDVARLADVSVKTASNVANGRVHVSDTTRRRVERAIDELGYRPNQIARALRRGGQETLTLIVPGRLRADSDGVVDQIIQLAAALGCHVVTDDADVSPDELGLLVVPTGTSPGD